MLYVVHDGIVEGTAATIILKQEGFRECFHQSLESFKLDNFPAPTTEVFITSIAIYDGAFTIICALFTDRLVAHGTCIRTTADMAYILRTYITAVARAAGAATQLCAPRAPLDQCTIVARCMPQTQSAKPMVQAPPQQKIRRHVPHDGKETPPTLVTSRLDSFQTASLHAVHLGFCSLAC